MGQGVSNCVSVRLSSPHRIALITAGYKGHFKYCLNKVIAVVVKTQKSVTPVKKSINLIK